MAKAIDTILAAVEWVVSCYVAARGRGRKVGVLRLTGLAEGKQGVGQTEVPSQLETASINASVHGQSTGGSWLSGQWALVMAGGRMTAGFTPIKACWNRRG